MITVSDDRAQRFPRSTLVVVDDADLTSDVLSAAADALRGLGGRFALLAVGTAAHVSGLAIRDALVAGGLDVHIVPGAELDPVDALAAQLRHVEHHLVVVVLDHFGASALGTLDQARQALSDVVAQGVSMLFLAPPLLGMPDAD